MIIRAATTGTSRGNKLAVAFATKLFSGDICICNNIIHLNNNNNIIRRRRRRRRLLILPPDEEEREKEDEKKMSIINKKKNKIVVRIIRRNQSLFPILILRLIYLHEIDRDEI